MSKKIIRKYLFWILVVAVFFSTTAILLHILANHPRFQQYVVEHLSTLSPFDIKVGKIHINYHDGLGVKAENVVARSKKTAASFKVAQVDLAFNYRDLIKGYFFPQKVATQNLQIELGPAKTRSPMTPDRLAEQLSRIEPLFFKTKQVELKNTTIASPNSKYGINTLNVLIQPHPDDVHQREIRINGSITTSEAYAPFTLNGVIHDTRDKSATSTLALDLQLKQVPLEQLRWPKRIRFFGGKATGDFHITGPKNNRFIVSGNMMGHDLDFTVHRKGRSKGYTIPQATVHFDGDLGFTDLRLEMLTVRTQEAQVELSMQFDWRTPVDPSLDLMISSKPVTLAVFKDIFPTPLVPVWIETKLFPLFTDGAAQLDRLRLNGTIGQMKKMNRPENAHVFEMRLGLNQLKALPEIPDLEITDVHGEVDIRHGRLLVSNVKGRFGTSALTRGTLNWPSLTDKSRRYTLEIQGDFNLEDLKRQGTQPVLPPAIRREISRIQGADGPITTDIELDFSGIKKLPSLTGTIETNGSRIHHSALILPINLHSGRFDFDNNGTIQINTNGRFGTSDLSVSGWTGRLWKSDGPVRRPRLNLEIDATVGLPDLISIKKMAILPASWQNPLAGIKDISGTLASKVIIRRKAIDAPAELVGTLSASNASMTHANVIFPLEIQDGQMTIRQGGTTQFNGAGLWGQSSYRVEGKADLVKKTLQATLSTQADLNDILHHLGSRSQPLLEMTQRLPTSVEIKKAGPRWGFTGEVALDAQVITLPMGIIAPDGTGNRLTFDVDYVSGNWMINTCRYFGQSSRLTLKTKRTVSIKSSPHIEITATPLDFNDIGLQIASRQEGELRKVKGILHGEIHAELPLDMQNRIDFRNSKVNGSVTLEGILLGEKTDSLPLQADLRFQDRDIDIVQLTFPFGNSQGHLKGRLTGWDRWRGRLNVDLNCLDLPRLIERNRSDSSNDRSPITRFISNADIEIGIQAHQAVWETIDLGKLSAKLQYQNGRLRIEHAVFDAPSGMIKFAGSLPGKDNKTASLVTYFKLEKIPLDDIWVGLHQPVDRMQGILSAEGGLAIRGRNQTEIFQNLAGKFNVEITEGEVKKSSIIIKILDFLSIQNIFLRRPPDILKSRFYFKSIKGHVTIENGQFTTDQLLMKSPVLNAAVRGSYDLPRSNLNFLVGVQPLNTIDRIISKIPIIGHILTGKKKAILVYYFKIKGRPNEVIVKHIPFKNLDEAIIGYFKRLFLTPTRLLTKISDTLGDIAEDIRTGTGSPEPRDPSTMGP